MNPSPSLRAGALPANVFFATPEQRAAWARQRFFEEGVRPTGLVSEAVIQSWSRCLQQHQEPGRVPEFNPVTASRIHSVLGRNRVLLDAAAGELQRLQHTLAGTTAVALLVDPQGVVMHTTWTRPQPEEVLLPLAARVGVCLSEDQVGTNAPGLSARTAHATTVMGIEHFCTVAQRLYCAAAPVRDIHGRLAAVLDLTSEGVPFGFDAAAVVGLYATAIENRLLCAQARGQLLVRLQLEPNLLATTMAGLLGLDERGRIAWINPTAAALLGLRTSPAGPEPLDAEEVLGQRAEVLLAWACSGEPMATRLPNGLTLWLRCTLHDGAHAAGEVPATLPVPPPAPAPLAAEPLPPGTTLRDVDRQLIERALQACGGNLSRAARKLGVSRGLIYRHLRSTRGR